MTTTAPRSIQVVTSWWLRATWRAVGVVFAGRKGAFNIIAVAFQDHILSQDPSFTHSDNIIGDAASLSDSRLKHHRDPVSGAQALSVLSQIQAFTYDRPDLQQRRLGLIADEVEEAIEQLAIDNVTGTRWHEGESYKTLDYSRLVPLLVSGMNTLSARVKDLESKVNGTSS